MNKPFGTDAKKPDVGRHEKQQKKTLCWLDKCRRYRMSLIVGLIGLALSLMAFFVVNQWETQWRKLGFEKLAEVRCHLFENKVKHDLIRLMALKQFFDASQFVGRNDFTNFIEPLHEETQRSVAFYWSPRVTDSDRHSFEKAVQAEGYADFNIHCNSPIDSMGVITQHREYYPVLYRGNDATNWALAFDMSSKPNIKKAIEKAIDIDQPVVTTSAIFANGQEDWPETWLLHPVYYKDLPVTTVEDRRLAVKGIVVCAIQIDDIFDQLIHVLSPTGINMEIADVSSIENKQSLYQYKARLRGGDANPNEECEASGLVYTTTFDFADRTLEMRATPSLGYLDNHFIWVSWIVFLGGLLLTALLVIQFYLMRNRTIMVEKLVIDRTVQLQESNERFQVAFEIANTAICLEDIDGRFTSVNKQMCRMCGYTKEELVSMTIKDITHPEDLDVIPRSIWSALSDTIDNHRFIMRYIHKDGQIISGEVSSSVVRDDQGNPLYFISYILDITKRKKAEEALKVAQRYTRGLVEANLDALVAISVKGKITDVNTASELITGISRKEIIGTDFSDYFAVPDAARKGYQQVFRDGYVRDYPLEIKHRDGEITPVLYNASVYLDVQGNVAGIFAAARDITKQKRNEEELRKLSFAIEQSANVIVITDTNGIIEYVNPKFTESTGYTADEVIGQTPRVLKLEETPDESHKELWETITSGKTWNGTFHNKKKSGELYWEKATISPMTDESGSIIGYLAIKEDITEQREYEKERQMLELEMNQSRKLEAVGSLASGIAHEINTPIQFVGDNTNFLSDSFETILSLIETYDNLWQKVNAGADLASLYSEKVEAEDNADLEYLKKEVPSAIEQSLEGVQRVTKIVRAMKDFAHSDQGTKSMSNLNEMLESTLTVVRNELKYVSNVETELDPELPIIECYRDDLNQVFLNLLVNAAHTIADVVGDASGAKGTITVSTTRENEDIVIRITDTGKGIPKSIQDRIFDPFFSTKDVGKGSGQGLSIARKIIVEKHKGSLDFETEEGKGTIFIIRLPISIHEKIVEVT